MCLNSPLTMQEGGTAICKRENWDTQEQLKVTQLGKGRAGIRAAILTS